MANQTEPSKNESWVELCDEELDREHEIDDSTLTGDDDNDKPTSNRVNESLEEGEIRDDSTLDASEELATAETSKIAKILTYAKVLSGSSPGPTNEFKEPARKVATISTDELSLTSHLDVFHVDSPCKEATATNVEVSKEDAEIQIFLDENTVMFSPVKEERNPVKNMKRPFKLVDSPVQSKRERNNASPSVRKVAKSNFNSDVHSTENSSPSSKRELEVNPDVLSRRQKQLDYGKNTVGYDRYLQMVPKNERTKDHPKTPPKHLKMSRRAWDGLVKNWRVKLHKYDPNFGNDDFDMESVGNCDQYSLSDEISSYDSSSVKSDSTPSTPVPGSSAADKGDDDDDLWSRDQSFKSEKSKELWPDCPPKSDKSDEDDFLGCKSLKENCVKACS